MYGKVLVYFLISEWHSAAPHTACTQGSWGECLHCCTSPCTQLARTHKKRKQKCMLLGGKKKRERERKQLKQLTRKGQSALSGWQSFYGYSPTADLLRWRQWLQSSFSLVAFTTCLLKPPLCYRAVDHNQNSLCEIEFTSGHRGIASWIAGSSPCTACPEINNLQYCTFLNTEEPLKAACYLKKGFFNLFPKSVRPEY